MAPNGNGAVYEALVVNGCLKQMYIKHDYSLINLS